MRSIIEGVFAARYARASLVVLAFAIPALAASPVHGGLLYQTGFEAPGFTAGQSVDGQGGFVVPSGNNPGALAVTNTNAYSGSQALEGIGSQLTAQPDGLFQSTAGVNLNYDATQSAGQIVTLSSYMELNGPSTNTGNGTGDDLVSINMEAILSDGSYFSTYLSSNGQAYGFTTNYDFSASAALGVYHQLELILNFANRTSTFEVDGNILGTMAFDPSVQSTTLQSTQFTFYSYPQPYVNPSDYTAYIDDFSVANAVVPEPSSVLLSLIGLGAAAIGVRWRWGGTSS